MRKQRKEQAIWENEQRELDTLRNPVVNQKYNSKISCRNIIDRINAEMKAKQARLRKMKEETEAKRNQEEEEALAIRDSKSKERESASALVARQ